MHETIDHLVFDGQLHAEMGIVLGVSHLIESMH